MKYIDEYRDSKIALNISNEIKSVITRPWKIMEICGGQTHSILKYGLKELLPPEIELIHGPGCPVCVTPLEMIDKTIELASKEDVIVSSYGDMLRVPGSTKDLLTVKAEGGDVRIAYSPLDAVKMAQENPDKEVVFFAVGFETTAPGHAMALHQAARLKLENFSMICSHVLVPPAMEAILSSEYSQIQGFLAAGHVCTVMGYEDYFPIAEKYKTPIVITGFEPADVLQGILMAVKQLEKGTFTVENQYSRVVDRGGNKAARKLLEDTFDISDRKWRGIGEIPLSGFKINDTFSSFDAEIKFNITDSGVEESTECIAGLVLQGIKKPVECPAFGSKCIPENPLGAPMVSTEGACAAYFHYGSK